MLTDFQKNGKYLMLALDHRGSFKKYANSANPESATDADITSVKKMIIDSVYDDMSGVLIDPDWGLPAYQGGDKPFLLCVEKTGYTDKEGERLTELEYSIDELKMLGADGIKLLLYYNPAAANKSAQIETARKVLADSRVAGLPLFLEFVTYGNEALGKSRSEWVLSSVREFLDADVIADVFKLEYPGDSESCAKITEMLGSTPWILLTRGEPYEVFKKQLEDAVQAGAVGFLAGRAIWQEIADYPDDAGKQEFLNNVAKKRFKEICEIALQ
jgi:tagatose-1,6-bisphosphate aldolase